MKNSFWVFFCLILCVLILLSCNKSADEQTLLQYARAKKLYSEGRFSETSEMLADTTKFVPALSLRAKADYFAGDLDRAELSLRRAIKKRPSAFEARLYLARILREKGDSQKAEKIAFDLLTDNPYDMQTLLFASALAKQQGKYAEAQVFLNQAAELSAESAMVLLERANMHWQAGRVDEAQEDLKRANAMLPWDAPLVKSIEHLQALLNKKNEDKTEMQP